MIDMYILDKGEQEIGSEALYCISVSSGATRKGRLVRLLMPSHPPQPQTCSRVFNFLPSLVVSIVQPKNSSMKYI